MLRGNRLRGLEQLCCVHETPSSHCEGLECTAITMALRVLCDCLCRPRASAVTAQNASLMISSLQKLRESALDCKRPSSHAGTTVNRPRCSLHCLAQAWNRQLSAVLLAFGKDSICCVLICLLFFPRILERLEELAGIKVPNYSCLQHRDLDCILFEDQSFAPA